MCSCISYNYPQDYQTDKEVVLKPPFQDKTVCIDYCIVDEIKELWDAGFITLGCCCGHNGMFKRNVIVNIEQAEQLREYIDKNFN